MTETKNGWDELIKEVQYVMGDDFQINPDNCRTCFYRYNVVTHRMIDTTCSYFHERGLFSLQPEHVKFTMMFGCPHYEMEEKDFSVNDT